MNLEQNMQKLKNEAVAEEKFLESFLRVEQWWAKFKTPIIVAVVIVVFAFLGYFVGQWYDEKRIKDNYVLYEEVLKDPTSRQKIEALKQSNSPLYDLFLLTHASKESNVPMLEELHNSQDGFISMVSRYQAASLKGELAGLESLDVDLMLDEMILLQKAYLLLKADNIAQAHSMLGKIPLDSPLRGVAQFFEHYGITKMPTATSEHKANDGIDIFDTAPPKQEIEGIELFNGIKSQPRE